MVEKMKTNHKIRTLLNDIVRYKAVFEDPRFNHDTCHQKAVIIHNVLDAYRIKNKLIHCYVNPFEDKLIPHTIVELGDIVIETNPKQILRNHRWNNVEIMKKDEWILKARPVDDPEGLECNLVGADCNYEGLDVYVKNILNYLEAGSDVHGALNAT